MPVPAFRASAVALCLLCLPAAYGDQEQSKSTTSPPQDSSGVRLQGAEKDGGRRIRLGGIGIGVGYSRGWPGYGYYGPRYWGPAWYGSAAWNPWAFGPGWYDPFWYSPLGVHPGYWMGFPQGEGMGEVKLDTEAKTASVYIDGAYAGPVKDRRNMWLRPGTYELQVRDTDKKVYAQRIYVLSGKTLRIRPEFAETGDTP
jgi:hypothetical protein